MQVSYITQERRHMAIVDHWTIYGFVSQHLLVIDPDLTTNSRRSDSVRVLECIAVTATGSLMQTLLCDSLMFVTR